MGLESVIERIESEAKTEIKKIESEGESEAERIISEAQTNAEKFIASKAVENHRQIEILIAQERSGAELEVKKIRLSVEKEILEKTFAECLVSLTSLQHEKIIASLAEKIRREMPESSVIYSNKRDEKVARSLQGFTYGGTIDCIGGLVAENNDKTVRMDCRYETIAQNIWNSSLKEIAAVLLRRS